MKVILGLILLLFITGVNVANADDIPFINTEYGVFYGGDSGFFKYGSNNLYADKNGVTIQGPVRAFFDRKTSLLIAAPLSGVFKLDYASNTISVWSKQKYIYKFNLLNGIIFADSKENLYQIDDEGNILKSYFDEYQRSEKPIQPKSFSVNDTLHILTNIGHFTLNKHDVLEKKGASKYNYLVSVNDGLYYFGNESKAVYNNRAEPIFNIPTVKLAIANPNRTNEFYVLDMSGNLHTMHINPIAFTIEFEQRLPSSHHGNINALGLLQNGDLLLATSTGMHIYSRTQQEIHFGNLGVTNTVGAVSKRRYLVYRQSQGIFDVTDGKLTNLVSHIGDAVPNGSVILNGMMYVSTNNGLLVFSLLKEKYLATLLKDIFVRRIKVIDENVYVMDGFATLWRVINDIELEMVFKYPGDYMQFAVSDFLKSDESWLLAANDGLYEFKQGVFSQIGLEDKLIFRLIERESDILAIPFQGLSISKLHKSNPSYVMEKINLMPGTGQLRLDSAFLSDNQHLWLAVDDKVYQFNQDLNQVKSICDECFSNWGTLSGTKSRIFVAADNKLLQIDWREFQFLGSKPAINFTPLNGELSENENWVIEKTQLVDELQLSDSTDLDSIWYKLNNYLPTKIRSDVFSHTGLNDLDRLTFLTKDARGEFVELKTLNIHKPNSAKPINWYQYALVAYVILSLLLLFVILYIKNRIRSNEQKLNINSTLDYREQEIDKKQEHRRSLKAMNVRIQTIKKLCQKQFPELMDTGKGKNQTIVTMVDGTASSNIGFDSAVETFINSVELELNGLEHTTGMLLNDTDLDLFLNSEMDLKSLLHTKESTWQEKNVDVKLHTHIDKSINIEHIFSITAWGLRELIYEFIQASTKYSPINDVHVYLNDKDGFLIFTIDDYGSSGSKRHEEVDLSLFKSTMSEIARRHGGVLNKGPVRNKHNGYSCEFQFLNLKEERSVRPLSPIHP